MNSVQRLMPTLLVEDLSACKSFYTALFAFEVGFDSDWFVQMRDAKNGLEMGLMKQDHELVPKHFRHNPAGCMLTFVVEDVEPVFQQATERGFTVVAPPEDTFYGQRRLLLTDPAGTLVDVSAPIPNFSFS